MNKPTAIIVDDEELARVTLAAKLQRITQPLQIVGEAADVTTAVKLITQLQPDIVFLDIDMPRISGLELLGFFKPEEITFRIIFVTGYAEYAIQALRLSAADFLVKPVNVDELNAAVERTTGMLQQQVAITYSTLLNNRQPGAESRIAIPTPEGLYVTGLSNILYLKADGSYTHIYLANDKLTLSRKLGEFEHLTANPAFVRSHRSYIINTAHIKLLSKNEGAIMNNGDEVSVSADKRAALAALLGANKL